MIEGCACHVVPSTVCLPRSLYLRDEQEGVHGVSRVAVVDGGAIKQIRRV